ncbi:T9SS type A sorting domain-containing protein [Flavobacterium sp. RSB2_4_14]|uniref:T9SS type A sorting domain-containing protein n=1 Tax=Flavobacterium sp. RSB2_4_14 TaxID=3447665 RepID=UPI003F32E97F
MNRTYITIISLGFIPIIYGQTLSSTNSGAVSNNDLIYSVGEVFVTPINQNEASSGVIGVVSRIEFTSLGIADVEASEILKFYPNPTSHSVFLELKNENIKKIYIFDLNGKLIENKNVVINQINLSNLQTGTYIIKTDNHKIKSFKIIKR